MGVEAQVIGGILMAQSALTLIVMIVCCVKSFRSPTMASKKYIKVELSDLDKKSFFVLIPGSVLMFIAGLCFREAFGVKINYSGMVVLLNVLACDIMLLNMFLYSSGMTVFLNEKILSGGGRQHARSSSAENPVPQQQQKTGSADMPAFNQMQFELQNSLILVCVVVLVITLQLRFDKFSLQGLWYGLAMILIILATLSLIFSAKKLDQSIKYSEVEAAKGLSNLGLESRLAKVKGMKMELTYGIFAYAIIIVVNLLLTVMSSICTATPEEAWSPTGYQITVVPEMGLLLISTSFVSLSFSLLRVLGQRQRLAHQEQVVQDGVTSRKASQRSVNVSHHRRDASIPKKSSEEAQQV